MTTLPIQRRLDSLAREVEKMHETLAAVAVRVEAHGPINLAATAEALLATRRTRGEALGAQLFADPAWDMLLALFAAGEQGKPLSVSRLCAAAGVAQTTALRWLEQLEHGRLVTRAADRDDARRTLVSLSPEARDKMGALIRQFADVFTGAAPAA
jgi:DNA-binding MarR family transcriptional regulator